jgi:diadenosine tetraphosphate (Ap4A) HIT family hydrolase
VPGYTVAVWNGRHVSESTQLAGEQAAGYWPETLRVGRAVEQGFEHAKMNYQMLGNTVPHLHAHIIPRPLLPFRKRLQSQAGADAMKFGGVRPETIVIFERRAATCEGVRARAGGNASPWGSARVVPGPAS